MTLKSAAFLAFAGTLLLAILLVFDLIHDVISVAGGLIPALMVLRSLVYTFAGSTVAVFFYVLYKSER